MSDENTNTSDVTTDPEQTQDPEQTPSTDPQTTDPDPTPDPEPTVFDKDNILHCTKACLGLALDYTPFDSQIILDINTVLGIVNQLGIGVHGYRISDEDNGKWTEFMAPELDDDNFIDEVKTYVYKRVQLLFDPPTSGILMESVNHIIQELEWRILVKKETP